MTSSDTPRPVRDIPVGTLVIYTQEDSTYEYGGDADRGFDTVSYPLAATSGVPLLRCQPADVAPADTLIPLDDERVSVEKVPRGRYPSWQGPWLLRVAGQRRSFHRTKRDATAAGLRIVAILDWHAGPTPLVTLPHTGIQIPHTRLHTAAVKTVDTNDGQAYTARLHLDGRQVGIVSNDGNGGPTTWQPLPATSAQFGPRQMAAFADACRDEDGQPIAEEFVLAHLIEETQNADAVNRIMRAGKVPVRTRGAIIDHDDQVLGTYTAALGDVPGGWAERLDLLSTEMWRERPAAHAIEMWTGHTWQRLHKPTTTR